MMISEKMVFTSSNGNHLVLYARPPAGISIQKCSVRSSFLLNKKSASSEEETLWVDKAVRCRRCYSTRSKLKPFMPMPTSASRIALT